MKPHARFVSAAVLLGAWSVGGGQAAPANARHSRVAGAIELTNHQPDILLQGKSRLDLVDGRAVHSPTLAVGAEGFRIDLYTKPVTAADGSDLPAADVARVEKAGLAVVMILLDKQGAIGQVNLTMVIPGSTVTRTVAWKAKDLESWSAGFHRDGARLTLRHTGVLNDVNAKGEALELTWKLDIDLPVTESARR